METPQGYQSPVSVPQPVEPLNQNINVTPEPMYQPLSEQKPTFAPAPEPQIPNMPVNNMTPNQAPVPNMNYNQGVSDMNNQDVIPSGVPNIPMNNPNQPVMPNPIPNPTESTVPNPITPPTPVAPQPMNFVAGPQQQGGNNNPYNQY